MAAIIPTCWHCGEEVFIQTNRHGTKPGQIYSGLGMREFRISKVCEFCFDKLTQESE